MSYALCFQYWTAIINETQASFNCWPESHARQVYSYEIALDMTYDTLRPFKWYGEFFISPAHNLNN